MYIIYSLLLRFVWPYLQRNIADRGARYLQERRDRRLKQMIEEKVEEAVPDYVPPAEIRHLKQLVEEKVEEVVPDYLPPAEILTDAPRSGANTVWFSLSGLLLGGAFGLVIYLLTRNTNSRTWAS